MLGQTEILDYLKRCNGDRIAIEEVLCGYVVWKYLKGRSTDHVLQKIKDLRMFLAVIGESAILRASSEMFSILVIECALVDQSRLGVSPTTSAVGKEVWNRIRRKMSRTQMQVITDGQYGGPAPVQVFLTPSQRRASSVSDTTERPPWLERYFLLRPQFRNLGVPSYPEGHERSDGETLPAYQATLSNHLGSLEIYNDESHESAASMAISAR